MNSLLKNWEKKSEKCFRELRLSRNDSSYNLVLSPSHLSGWHRCRTTSEGCHLLMAKVVLA